MGGERDLEKGLQEINGHKLDEIEPRTGRARLATGFAELKDDGTTACGCWIYSGVFPEPGRNRANERRRTESPLQPEWASPGRTTVASCTTALPPTPRGGPGRSARSFTRAASPPPTCTLRAL